MHWDNVQNEPWRTDQLVKLGRLSIGVGELKIGVGELRHRSGVAGDEAAIGR